MNFLGQYINLFKLTIAEDKVAAIKTIEYPITLSNLKYFLGLSGYLGLSIHYYVQVAQPL